jgi:hypothetical protein
MRSLVAAGPPNSTKSSDDAPHNDELGITRGQAHQGDDAGGVGEDLTPLGEWAV